METTYEEKAKFAMLLLEGTSLNEAKSLNYVVTPEDEIAWAEVAKAPYDYPPANETSGCAVPTFDWRNQLWLVIVVVAV